MKKSIVFSLLALTLAAFNLNAQEKQAGKIVTDYFAWVDAHNLDAVGGLLTEDFHATAPFSPVPFDKNGWRGVGQGFNTGFPDGKHELATWFASGNMVAVRGTWSGTNTGPNMGNPPTGNRAVSPFIALFELNGMGKIKSFSIQFDQKNFEAQLMAGINPNAAAEATIRGIMAAADAGDAEKLISYFAPDAMHYFGGQANTLDDLKKRVAAFKMGFPDIQRHIDEITVSNGTATIRGWLTGTNSGMFMGKPATGHKIKLSVLGVYKFNAAGKVTEAWVELDGAALMGQLMATAPK